MFITTTFDICFARFVGMPLVEDLDCEIYLFIGFYRRLFNEQAKLALEFELFRLTCD
jgi:hypothetical protein